jgi:putative transposase
MIVRKAYKFRFYPTKEQTQQLDQEFGNARFVWNHALSMRKKAYERRGESLNYVPLNKHITQLKKTNNHDWLKLSTSGVLTQKLIDLDTAYTNFFKHGAKFPRFKKKTHKQTIRYQLDQRQIQRTYKSGELLKLPKLGDLNIKWSQAPEGMPKMVTISKACTEKYFVSFSCEVDIQGKQKTGRSVGIDLGIKDVIVTSDGYFSGAPKLTKRNERRLRKANKDLSRKTKGSNRSKKQRIVVASVHEHIANSRKDFLHKETSKLIQQYDTICIEDLNVSGMVKNRKLSKAISDVGMFEIKRQLKYKADWYGKTVIEIDRWFPSTKMCSGCRQIHEMKLSQRIMSCDCGLSMNRDHNSAINIKAAGIVARGESSADARVAA